MRLRKVGCGEGDRRLQDCEALLDAYAQRVFEAHDEQAEWEHPLKSVHGNEYSVMPLHREWHASLPGLRERHLAVL